jgi:hypothetical protein
MIKQHLALFIMQGQAATKEMRLIPGLVPPEPLKISPIHDLSSSMPDEVRLAIDAAEAYKLFFVFERYLRDFVIGVLSQEGKSDWWSKVPPDVQAEITKLEETEEAKSWMALGSRGKAALMTYPQLLRVIEFCWKDDFEDLIRDRALIQQARLVGHIRNTVCHMNSIPEEELGRVKQTMRDWFRRVAP